ncbi:hypothetical protein WKI40_18000 [Kosakonia sacchari]|uniref:hypothetical protein n=1 Tax=Kosakonia TaxID=1330547 RepID=UPI00190B8DE0|nr:hypothetical protein [Kosakonia sp. LAM2021]
MKMVLSSIAINVSIANAQAERTFTIGRANDPMLTLLIREMAEAGTRLSSVIISLNDCSRAPQHIDVTYCPE